MTGVQAAAYVTAQAVACLCEMHGMLAANQDRERRGEGPAYDAEAFRDLPDRFGLHHNQVLTTFTGAYD